SEGRPEGLTQSGRLGSIERFPIRRFAVRGMLGREGHAAPGARCLSGSGRFFENWIGRASTAGLAGSPERGRVCRNPSSISLTARWQGAGGRESVRAALVRPSILNEDCAAVVSRGSGPAGWRGRANNAEPKVDRLLALWIVPPTCRSAGAGAGRDL